MDVKSGVAKSDYIVILILKESVFKYSFSSILQTKISLTKLHEGDKILSILVKGICAVATRMIFILKFHSQLK